MLLVVIRVLFAFICAGALAVYVGTARLVPAVIVENPFWSFVGLLLITQAFTFIDILFSRKRIDVISAIYFGLLVGFFLSSLLNQALGPLLVNNESLKQLTALCTTLILPYICISLLLQTRDDFRFIIPYVEFSKDVKGGRPFLIDTSSLIDGRIADVVDTKIIDSEIVVPTFILQELQDIADSNDKLRRARGRRGLDVLSKLQSNPNVEVRLHETDPKEGRGIPVDQRLVDLAKTLGGRVVTNDFNLNKVASLLGVDVVNLNDVANSLKPRYLPGEHIHLKVIKLGEGVGQGVGYLDDGTMVVCEQGSHLVGKETTISVTSVLQNSAGRMIFGRPVLPDSAPMGTH